MRLAVVLGLVLSACVSSASPRLGVTAVPVPIYRETLRTAPHARYYLSTRTAAEAESFGWQQLEIAFFAFITPEPGTVPVYCETPASAPHSDYRFSARDEDVALAEGWMRLHLAFYAYPSVRPGTVPIGGPLGIAFHALDPAGFPRPPG